MYRRRYFDLAYQTADKQERYQLDGYELFTNSALDLRGAQWKVTLGEHDLLSAKRTATTCTIDFKTPNREALEALRIATDKDVLGGNAGTLIAKDDWTQRAFITGLDVQNVYGGYVEGKLTVQLLDGVWRKSIKHTLAPQSGLIINNGDLDYAHDYPHDYTNKAASIKITFEQDSLVRLTFYGSCIDPYVNIGGNVYALNDISIPAGSYAVIDPTRKGEVGQSIKLVSHLGEAQNIFAKRRRGAQGTGSYIFERVHKGAQTVTWAQDFGLDIEEIRERSEPPWI